MKSKNRKVEEMLDFKAKMRFPRFSFTVGVNRLLVGESSRVETVVLLTKK